jgi:hypothetical protein
MKPPFRKTFNSLGNDHHPQQDIVQFRSPESKIPTKGQRCGMLTRNAEVGQGEKALETPYRALKVDDGVSDSIRKAMMLTDTGDRPIQTSQGLKKIQRGKLR